MFFSWKLVGVISYLQKSLYRYQARAALISCSSPRLPMKNSCCLKHASSLGVLRYSFLLQAMNHRFCWVCELLVAIVTILAVIFRQNKPKLDMSHLAREMGRFPVIKCSRHMGWQWYGGAFTANSFWKELTWRARLGAWSIQQALPKHLYITSKVSGCSELMVN